MSSPHDIVAMLVLYTGGEYRLANPYTPEAVVDWPIDGVQVGMIFFAGEWAEGKPYRQVVMGNDSYFFTPNGIVGHSDETPAEIRSRYGLDTAVLRGRWTTANEIHALAQVAMECDSIDKLTDEWIAQQIAEALA
jgi:hypothetical protein